MAPLRVLQSESTPNQFTNPYISQMFSSLTALPDVVVIPWSVWNALFAHFDVFHFHWPELIIRKRTRLRSLVATLLFLLFYARVRFLRTPVVRTVHNAVPHEGLGWLGTKLITALERQAIAEVHLTNTTITETSASRAIVIPHGHYRDWFAQVPRGRRVTGRYAYAGLLRRYKGVDDLLRAFMALPDDNLSLTIAGQASDFSYRDELLAIADHDPRVNLTTRFLADDEIVRHITEAELFVLPYKYVVNSGAALLALSLNTPVLVRDSPSMRELAIEVGEGWVQTFDGDLAAEDLANALIVARAIPLDGRPELRRREWDSAAADLASLYTRACARR